MLGLRHIFLFLFLFHASFALDGSPAEVTATVDRVIDITSQVVKVMIKYELTNKGKSEFNSFIHLLSESEQAKLAYITAAEDKKDGKLHVVKAEVQGLKKRFAAYRVELLTSVAPDSKAIVTVEYHLTEYLEPFPAKITQAEAQHMVYNGNAHVPMLYTVTKETTKVILPPGKLVSHTTVTPSKSEGNKITYGPYADQKPYAVAEIKIHNENNSPFVVATDVLRHIEVSHWGNIAVEETIELVHKGAELKGPFSRLDFQLDRRGNRRPVVTQYKTLLPVTAKDIYYRDEIGNISTSTVRKISDAVEMTVQPRFPLFGGWKTNYVLGYNLPAYQYLFSSGKSFALKMRLLDHLFDSAVIEHLKVKIVLPEGSKNFKLITPYSVKRGADELHVTYLDTTGRPVVVIEKDNLVDAHIQPFTDTAKEGRLQAHGHVEQLSELHSDRLKLYDHCYDVAQKYRNSKDYAAFAANKKKTENDLKNVTQAFTDAQTELKSTNAEMYEKLNEVNKLHKTATDLITNYLVQAERLVKGNMSKTDFANAEKIYNQKMGEVKEKMDTVIYGL